MVLTTRAEEEKKSIAPLLGKLYVSPSSSEDKIRALYAEVSDAVDSQLLADATGRNALYKIHVALGKIVNNLDQAQADPGFGRRSVSTRAPSVALSIATAASIKEEDDDRTIMDDRTVVEDRTVIKEEDEEDDSGGTTVLHHDDGDSLVEELLTDGE